MNIPNLASRYHWVLAASAASDVAPGSGAAHATINTAWMNFIADLRLLLHLARMPFQRGVRVQRGQLFHRHERVPLLDGFGHRNRRAGAESNGHDLLRPDRKAVARPSGQRIAAASRKIGQPSALMSQV